MNSIFNPAIKLMNRFSYPKKMIVLGVIAVLTVSFLFLVTYHQLNKTIVDSKLRLEGIDQLIEINKAIQLTQKYRGLSVATQGGNTDLLPEYIEIKKETETAFFNTIASLDPLVSEKLDQRKITALWKKIKHSYGHGSIEDDFSEHTELILQLRILADLVNEHYLLITDDELTSYYLIDNIINHIPDIAEYKGQIRAVVTGILTNKTMSDMQQEQLIKLDALIDYIFANFEFNIVGLKRHSPELAMSIDRAHAALVEGDRTVTQLIQVDVLSRKFKTPANHFYAEITNEIDSVYSLMYQTLIPSLQAHINRRISNAQSLLLLVLSGAGLLMMTSFYLMVGMYKAVINNINHIRHTVNAYADGDLEARINLDTYDEMRDISIAVNEMADSANQSRAEIEDERERYEVMFEKSGNGIAIIENGVFVDCNEKSVTLMGYKNKTELMVDLTKLSPEYQEDGRLSSEKTEDLAMQCQRDGSVSFEWQHLKKDGTIFWVDVLLTLVEYSGKQQIHAVWRDIDQIKKMQAEQLEINNLLLSEKAFTEQQSKKAQFMERVIENSLNEIYIFDVETLRFNNVNLGARKNLGYSIAELSQMTAFDIKPEFPEVEFREAVDPLITGNVEKLEFSTIHRRKDGSTYPVEVHLQLLDEKKPVFVAIIIDITERIEEEQRLMASEKSLKDAQMIAHLGSWELDLLNNALSWSDEVYRIFEINMNTIPSYDVFLSSMPLKDQEHVNKIYKESIKSGEPYSIEHRVIMMDGRIKYVHEQGETVYDDNGSPLRTFGSVLDITDRKHQELRLIELQESANEANKAKSEFLANMSHELRTPMHGILSFAGIGIKKVDSASKEKLTQYFTHIQTSGNRLLSLLNDLLDISKFESGKMQFSRQEADLVFVFDSCQSEQKQRMKDLGLTLQVNKTDEMIIGQFDAIRIGQVITNLLSNAIKFSPRGGVITISMDKNIEQKILFTIQDEGEGVLDEELDDIFDAFIQSSKISTGTGGTGLGLAISRQIIEGHSGRIWAENNESGGALFSFTLPHG